MSRGRALTTAKMAALTIATAIIAITAFCAPFIVKSLFFDHYSCKPKVCFDISTRVV